VREFQSLGIMLVPIQGKVVVFFDYGEQSPAPGSGSSRQGHHQNQSCDDAKKPSHNVPLSEHLFHRQKIGWTAINVSERRASSCRLLDYKRAGPGAHGCGWMTVQSFWFA